MEKIGIETKGEMELIDITERVREMVKDVKSGVCVLFTKHTTTGIVINENEDGLKQDILSILKEIIPVRRGYKHDRVDDNAHAHLRSILLGSSETIPIKDGRLLLGTWQSIFFVECDGPRHREVYAEVLSG
jgi:secondary thiamine-phosphate synthase enzyme